MVQKSQTNQPPEMVLKHPAKNGIVTYGCFQELGENPQNGWFILIIIIIMENPIKMDDLGVPLFLKTPIYLPYQRVQDF